MYQATLMSYGTANHVSVDCTITLLHFGVVEHSVKLVWVSFSYNAKPITLAPYHFTHSGCAHDSYCPTSGCH